MPVLSIDELELTNKRVLIRADFNVPLENGAITNDARIRATLPTIQHALECNASVLLVSHLGRPKPGIRDESLSLAPVALHLSKVLNQCVELVGNWHDGVPNRSGQVKLLENIRFEDGETQDDESLARSLASLCDVYVNDAFGTAHRAHASTHGVAKFAAESCAGLLLAGEIKALEQTLVKPKRPLVAVLGGAKVSGKLEVLHRLQDIADTVLVGGGMANTFLLSAGYSVGDSLVESKLTDDAKAIRNKTDLPLPVDVMTTKSIEKGDRAILRLTDQIPNTECIVDIGPETARQYASVIQNAGTVLWNGPMGIFEQSAFADGTKTVATAIAETDAYTLAGGGDTIAAIEKYQIADLIDYISTGGGAFLEFVEGKSLPGVDVLPQRSAA